MQKNSIKETPWFCMRKVFTIQYHISIYMAFKTTTKTAGKITL